MRSRRRSTRFANLAVGLGLSAGAGFAQGAEPASPRAFITWIFSHYPQRETSSFEPTGRSSRDVFDPPMVALFRQNDRLTPKGDAGSLDSDPICGCQDDTGLAVRRVTIAPAGALGASADVELVEAGGERRTERFDLVRVDGHWRIHDIHAKDMPSLRAFMIASNRDLAAHR